MLACMAIAKTFYLQPIDELVRASPLYPHPRRWRPR